MTFRGLQIVKLNAYVACELSNDQKERENKQVH
jgi:hypothetical protein